MRSDEYTPAVAAERAADKAQQSARAKVDQIVREHLTAIGFYDNRDAWAEETHSDMVNALLVQLGFCDQKGHDPIECSCELTEQDAVFHRGVVNDEAAEWRRVALAAWKHYRDKVWPSTNDIAHRHHAHHLAKMIPFLVGEVDEAWLPADASGAVEMSFMAKGISREAFAIITGLHPDTYLQREGEPLHRARFTDPEYQVPPENRPADRPYRIGELPRTVFGPGTRLPESKEDSLRLPKRQPGAAYEERRPAWWQKGQHAYVADASVYGCAALYEHKGTHAYCGAQEDADVHAVGVGFLRIECGAKYNDKTPPCSIEASWPHDEHSNGEWHWRTPDPEWVAAQAASVCKCPGECSHVKGEDCLTPERPDGTPEA